MSNTTEPLSSGSTPAVRRAARLLREVGQSAEPPTLSELARRLELSKSTLHSLIRALMDEGLLAQVDGQKRYRLGPQLAHLGHIVAREHRLDVVAPVLHRLARETGQTVYFGEVVGDRVHVLAREGGNGPLQLSVPAGADVPLYAGALVQAWLTALPRAERPRALAGADLPRYTARSIVDPDALLARVDALSPPGVAVECGEYIAGVCAACVALPRRYGTDVLWLVAMAASTDQHQLDGYATALADAARAIQTSPAPADPPPLRTAPGSP